MLSPILDSQGREVPEPDVQDYYLTEHPSCKTRRRNENGVPWHSIQKVLDRDAADELAYWGPEADAIESLLSEHREGGGLYGLDPVAHAVRSGLVALGSAEVPPNGDLQRRGGDA